MLDKDREKWFVLRIGSSLHVAKGKNVQPKHRLSPPLSKDEALLMRKLFK